MLAKHRAARAERPKEDFKKVEPAKKVGRVLFEGQEHLACQDGTRGRQVGRKDYHRCAGRWSYLIRSRDHSLPCYKTRDT
jgi:hypothetical protein